MKLIGAVVASVVIAGSWVAAGGIATTARAAVCATPSISSIYPNWGGMYAVTETVTIRGCGFTGATAVNFHNGFPPPAPTVVDDSTITIAAPPHVYAPGDYREGLGAAEDVTVTTPAGDSPVTPADQFYWYWGGTPCATAGISGALPASPGGPIVLTGTTFACTNPMYRFWVAPPGGAWRIVQDYTAAMNMVGTFSWAPPAGARGTYRFEVDVRDASRSSVAYDRVANMSYTIGDCIAAGISTSPASPSNPGTAVTLSGSAVCPGTPAYRFWIRAPGGVWKIVQDYSSTSTYAWTAGAAFGTYALEVDVRNAGSTLAYAAVANASYRVGVPCTIPTLSVQPSP